MACIKHLFIAALALSAFSHPASAEDPGGYGGYGGGYGPGGFGGNPYGMPPGGMGSYPFQGGMYGMGGMGGMGGGGMGAGSSAKYESRTDPNELKESGTEYAEKIREQGDEFSQSAVETSQKALEAIGKTQLEEAEIPESITKASEKVAEALDTKPSSDTVSKIQEDIVKLGKLQVETMQNQTKSLLNSLNNAAPKELPPPPGLAESLVGVPLNGALTSPNRRPASGGGMGGILNQRPQGSPSPMGTIPLNPSPATEEGEGGHSHDHGFAARQAGFAGANASPPGSVTTFERGLLHNPPKGY